MLLFFFTDKSCDVSISISPQTNAIKFTKGQWFFDENILHIQCETTDNSGAVRNINWSSVYRFINSKNSFALLVPPYPDASNARIVFMRTQK
jgi:hypothetical protein